MSASKKANKKASTESAQETAGKDPARSLRGTAKETEQTALARSSAGQSREAVPGSKETRRKRGSSKFSIYVLRILAFLVAAGITIYIYSIRERAQHFGGWGYPAAFFIALLANATVLLPAPGLAIIYTMGGVFHPLGVGLAAGTGGAIGELSGYLAGFSGQFVIERMDIYNRIKPWLDRYGGWMILFLAAIPNPFFDIVGIAAGIAKIPMRTFFLFTWIGQLIKMTMFAFAGHYSITFFMNFIK